MSLVWQNPPVVPGVLTGRRVDQAGFLFGLAKGRSLLDCGRLGALAPAEVISHYGPRPQVSLAELAGKNGL